MPGLLLDLSAWARSSHPDTRERWSRLVRADELACHPVFAVELLHNSISPQDYHELRRDIDGAFDWVWPSRDTAQLALQLQRRMAESEACGQRVKTADLLIAALAVEHGMGVVHYDKDYDAIREWGGEAFVSEWLAPRGSLEGSAESRKNTRHVYRKAFGERMVELQEDADLDVWPKLIAWLDEQLKARQLPVPPTPEA